MRVNQTIDMRGTLEYPVIMGKCPYTGSTDRAGNIKTVRITQRSLTNPILHLEAETRERMTTVRAVTVRSELVDAGWELLQEAYEREGDKEGWEAYKTFVAACKSGEARGPVRHGKTGQELRKADEFPDEMLPASVRKLRADRLGKVAYQPPTRKKTKAQAA